MRNRAEAISLGNRTFCDPTAFDAIRKADMGDGIVRPKTFHVKQSRSPDVSIPDLIPTTNPVILLSTNNPRSNSREITQPDKGYLLNKMTIDQLNELSAQIQFQRKFKRAITDTDYSALMRAIDRERQWKKRKAKL